MAPFAQVSYRHVQLKVKLSTFSSREGKNKIIIISNANHRADLLAGERTNGRTVLRRRRSSPRSSSKTSWEWPLVKQVTKRGSRKKLQVIFTFRGRNLRTPPRQTSKFDQIKTSRKKKKIGSSTNWRKLTQTKLNLLSSALVSFYVIRRPFFCHCSRQTERNLVVGSRVTIEESPVLNSEGTWATLGSLARSLANKRNEKKRNKRKNVIIKRWEWRLISGKLDKYFFFSGAFEVRSKVFGCACDRFEINEKKGRVIIRLSETERRKKIV